MKIVEQDLNANQVDFFSTPQIIHINKMSSDSNTNNLDSKDSKESREQLMKDAKADMKKIIEAPYTLAPHLKHALMESLHKRTDS